MVRIFLTTLAIGFGQCLSWADGVTNAATNLVVEKNGQYTIMWTNGRFKYVNPAEFWNGVWKEGANGWRVQLRVYPETNWWFDTGRPGVPVSTNLMLRVEWGSPVKNSGGGYFMAPNGKFAKFQLLDANRKVIPPNPGAGTNLLARDHQGNLPNHTVTLKYGSHVPAWVAPESGSLEGNFPETISTNVYPSFSDGGMAGDAECVSNRPPFYLSLLKLDEIYSVPTEGDYTLVVQPVVYKESPTNRAVLNRVDLPSVAAKVHMAPKVK